MDSIDINSFKHPYTCCFFLVRIYFYLKKSKKDTDGCYKEIIKGLNSDKVMSHEIFSKQAVRIIEEIRSMEQVQFNRVSPLHWCIFYGKSYRRKPYSLWLLFVHREAHKYAVHEENEISTIQENLMWIGRKVFQ